MSVRGQYSKGVAARFVRRVRTASGAVAVQVVAREGRDVVEVYHVGSAHDDAELELLLQAAQERLQPGQGTLDLGPLERCGASMKDNADCAGKREHVDHDEPSMGPHRVAQTGG